MDTKIKPEAENEETHNNIENTEKIQKTAQVVHPTWTIVVMIVALTAFVFGGAGFFVAKLVWKDRVDNTISPSETNKKTPTLTTISSPQKTETLSGNTQKLEKVANTKKDSTQSSINTVTVIKEPSEPSTPPPNNDPTKIPDHILETIDPVDLASFELLSEGYFNYESPLGYYISIHRDWDFEVMPSGGEDYYYIDGEDAILRIYPTLLSLDQWIEEYNKKDFGNGFPRVKSFSDSKIDKITPPNIEYAVKGR